MTGKRKYRVHRLSADKSLRNVLLVTAVMMFSYFFMAQIIIGVGAAITLALITGKDILTNEESINSTAAVVSVFSGFIVIFFYFWWFRPEYKWKERRSLECWKLISPVLIYWAVFFGIAHTIAFGRFTFGIPEAFSAITSLAAGICEEVAFREVGISYMKRQLKGPKWNLPIILITAGSFGAFHLINAIKAGSIFGSLLQTVLATMFGIFFGAVYLRTGNIWPCIIVHALHDLLTDCFSVNCGLTDRSAYLIPVAFVCEALLMVWGLYLVRKEKNPEIHEIWSRKWTYF